MLDITVLIPGCNSDLLYAQLSTAGYFDVSIMNPSSDPANPYQITLHFVDGVDQSVIDAATAIVRAHNATQLSSAQKAQAVALQQKQTLSADVQQIGTRLSTFHATSLADVR